MKRILFVDEDISALQGARRMLRSISRDWHVELAQSAQEALEILEQGESFELVVSEIRLPGMDGLEFFKTIRDNYPLTARFALSGRADSDALLKVATVTHQFVSKPCDARHLANLVARTLSIRDHLHAPEMRKMLLGIGALPSIPSVYTEIMEEIQSRDPSVRRVGEIISKDVSMSAKILHIVNSAYMGLGHDVRDPIHAATLLGIEHLKNIALAVGLFSIAESKSVAKHFDMESLWQHSLRVADFAKRIAESEVHDRKLSDYAFTAGLLHDAGLIILATKKPAELDAVILKAKQDNIPLFEAERLAFGVSHAQLGACLLELWGLPDAVVEAIAYHDYPSARPQDDFVTDDMDTGGYDIPDAVNGGAFAPLTAVHVANLFTLSNADGTPGEEFDLDTPYLESLGMDQHISSWWDTCFSDPA